VTEVVEVLGVYDADGKSSERTGWSGTTAGTIVYAGRTYYARVYQTATTLSCGG